MAGIVRVARDGSAVIVKVDNIYKRVLTDLSSIESSETLETLIAGRQWRKPVATDPKKYADHTILATSGIVDSAEPTPERRIRLPKSVQRLLAENAETLAEDPLMLSKIQQLATTTTTSYSEIQWLSSKLEEIRATYNSLGGDTALIWFQKVNKSGITAAGEPFSPSESLEYYGIAENERTTKVTGLVAVNREDDIVLTWTPEGFVPVPESVDQFQAGTIVEIDPDTASAVANWVNEGGNSPEGFDITYSEATEANLVSMALEEAAVWNNVDAAADAIIAALPGPDPYLYTPQERSQNAQRQQRSGNGTFGGPQLDKSDASGLGAFAKAHLTAPLPLLLDPAARIAEYLGNAADAPAAPTENPAPLTAAAGADPNNSAVTPLYLAVVDPVDNTAVLEIAAVLPNGDGTAAAWVRNDGQWVPNNDLVADLQGATPPPVVELTDEATIKDVLSQADASDQSAPAEDSSDRANAPVMASASMYGDYGEILPTGVVLAAGIPGVNDTPSDAAATERLMRYWTVGPGAAKIRWGTPGDLTRAHRYLAKYVGPKRAWGLAQNLHKRVLGMPNATHDKITGQN